MLLFVNQSQYYCRVVGHFSLKETQIMLAVNGSGSQWTSVTSGEPQGSVLAAGLFNIFINEKGTQCTLSKCVDHTKLSAAVYTPKGQDAILKDRMPEGHGQYQDMGVWESQED